jgi:hypothetical protein
MTTKHRARALHVGDRVRVIAPDASTFRGYEGRIVGFGARKGKQEYAIQLPDHPWQVKSPEARWFFSADELELI